MGSVKKKATAMAQRSAHHGNRTSSLKTVQSTSASAMANAAAGAGGEDAGRPQAQVQVAAVEVRSYFPFPYAAGPFRPSAGGGGGGVSLGTHQADQPPAPEVVAAQQQLPHFPYAPRGGGSASASLSVECAICLERLRRGELCSELPECRHVFHRDCVALWIKSKSTCPLCRARISPWFSGSIGAPPPPLADMV
ncbi:E3 ubiquitin-protein ligase EL5-like [Oryza sativa Japonica Group]|uniref:E3 ubiquitin-protein ligase EL5-like n=1 Tax=Oryza sativa subsp. japonica TaxID=39947 RepID=UPI0001C7C473|nr:E3 ubiquitin-protein ligase EL5-like [Oryza sativa Japonica Group]USH99622.1 zinc finger protein [Oryza sativa Japonica Group]